MPTVLVSSPQPGVTQLTLNRPEKLNAMNVALITELHEAFTAIAADQSCRAVVLMGTGRGFCAGLDLTGYGTVPGSEARGPVVGGFSTQQHIASRIPQMRALPVPVIAAVNGAAAGGGLALALGSDIRVAGAAARFNVAFVRIGLSGCDIGVSWLLPRLIGASRAWELMLTGRIIESAEADEIGLVTRVVHDDQLLDSALETASLIAANPPWGGGMPKEVAWSALEIESLQAGIDMENRTQILSSFTGDHREAITAFLDKRAPNFDGR